jgi:hypothetical protein
VADAACASFDFDMARDVFHLLRPAAVVRAEGLAAGRGPRNILSKRALMTRSNVPLAVASRLNSTRAAGSSEQSMSGSAA